MYQHDVDEKSLTSTLDSVVSESVSFVGVDVNCASENLLKFVAGLSEKKAEMIVEHRRKNGAFKSREELKKVKSIGPVTFTQMAGFLRINKATAKNLLDSTNIHPESYELAEKILRENKLKIEDLGKEKFKAKIKENSMKILCEKFKETPEKVENVLSTFKAETFLHDIRDDKNLLPVFKQSIKSVESLKKNEIVSGVVRNIVDFGAFIDIGVQQDGLLHISKFKGAKLKLGNRVELRIEKIEANGKRIGLDLIKIL